MHLQKYSSKTNSTFYYLCPELVKCGWLKNEEWVQLNALDASNLFHDKELKIAAIMLATSHPHALQYINQCPALVLMTQKKSWNMTKWVDRDKFRRRWKDLFADSPKLKDIAQKVLPGIQYLRAIKGSSIFNEHHNALTLLAKINPSTLAQTIPTQGQASWLNRIHNWVNIIERNTNATPNIEWLIKALAKADILPSTTDIHAVADFYVACHMHPELLHFSDRWSWSAALEHSRAWTNRANEFQARDTIKKYKKEWEEPLDYGKLPLHWEKDGWEIVALNTAKALYEEGLAMNNCIKGLYLERTLEGRCYIFSVRKGRDTVADFELFKAGAHIITASTPQSERKKVDSWQVGQLEGPNNKPTTPEVHKVVMEFWKTLGKKDAEKSKTSIR